MTVIVGLNAHHADSSACILVDGTLVAAAEEERFRRVKHWAGFPSEAMAYCLREAGVTLGDVAHLAVNSDPRANLLRKAAFAVRSRPDLELVRDRIRNARKRISLVDEIRQAFPLDRFDGQVHRVEHHLCHLMSSFHVSPFQEAVVLSVDGFGDFASAAWGYGSGQRVAVTDRVLFPHSLGIFYQALTQYLGFKHYGDEYKVMGLAPYGEPRFLPEMRSIVDLQEDGSFRLCLDYFRHHKEKVPYRWTAGSPEVGDLYSEALADLLGPERVPGEELAQRHRDLARSVQAMYEEAFFHLLERLHELYRSRELALAGGCGMNSVANGKVARRTPFERLYVQSAAGDAGGAIGAALAVSTELGESAPRGQMPHAYWGPAFSDGDVKDVLDGHSRDLEQAGCCREVIRDEGVLFERVAGYIAEGRVIGWFQGRMEWGPRALGNRSILGDPRRGDMKDILNLKIKRRESFRPFAPSILADKVSEWFEEEADVPFMMKVFQIRKECRGRIPAVTHADGSGRLQTVSPRDNVRYHGLIQAFEKLTGVPMLLNTSFNENEPVVCRPEEALACFLRTRMDVLVLGNHLITRRADDPPRDGASG